MEKLLSKVKYILGFLASSFISLHDILRLFPIFDGLHTEESIYSEKDWKDKTKWLKKYTFERTKHHANWQHPVRLVISEQFFKHASEAIKLNNLGAQSHKKHQSGQN